MMKKISEFLTNELFRNSLYELNTPAYIYHLDILEYVINQVKEKIIAMNNLKLYYAVKANSNKEILSFLSEYIDGVDVASIYEYKQAKEYFNEISITGPSFTSHELELLFKQGNKIDFNSVSQLENCGTFLVNKEVGIRVNIPYNFKEKRLNSRFGVSLSDERFYKLIDKLNVKIVRVHFHSGEKNSDFFNSLREQLNILNSRNLLSNIKEINLGGGLFDLILKNKLEWLINEIKKIEAEYFSGKKIQFIIEPGGGLLQLCGILMTGVISVDRFNGSDNVVVDASAYNLNHWFIPKLLTHSSNARNYIDTSVYGTTCYEGDYFFEGKNIKELSINDKLLFYPVGAYSKSNHTKLHEFPFPQEYYFLKDKINLR